MMNRLNQIMNDLNEKHEKEVYEMNRLNQVTTDLKDIIDVLEANDDKEWIKSLKIAIDCVDFFADDIIEFKKYMNRKYVLESDCE